MLVWRVTLEPLQAAPAEHMATWQLLGVLKGLQTHRAGHLVFNLLQGISHGLASWAGQLTAKNGMPLPGLAIQIGYNSSFVASFCTLPSVLCSYLYSLRYLPGVVMITML